LRRRPTTTDKNLKGPSNNLGTERRLRGHEILRALSHGRIDPGEYRYEVEYMDGSVEVETFRVDKSGHIRDLKIKRERPNITESEPASQKEEGCRSRRTTKRRPS
jgi:hypothetical protein